ncbi:MAG TPA: CoA transferase [Nocardioidaceae bacterium]|nr:CoA transferase [Nocardioidaceae bacterium]
MTLNPVRDAREELERRERPVDDKTMTPAQAVQLVRDGDHVAVGGTNYARTPMGLIFELLRRGVTGLSLSRALTCYEAELFLAAGMADRVVTSWVGIGHTWGLARVLRHYVENDLAEYEEWSHLGLALRYKAGAMGVPFLPTMSMLGSDLAGRAGAQEIHCPYTGQKLLAVPSLNPDVALIHVHRADVFGNAQIDGYSLMDVDVSRAARRVIVSAEEIVSTDVIRAAPERTVIPHFAVDAVVEMPFGSYPHECYGLYDADTEHISEYVAAVRARGPAGALDYIDRYVNAYPDFASFVQSAGEGRLDDLRAQAEEMMPR